MRVKKENLYFDDPAFGLKDAARYLGISPRSVLRWGVPRERVSRSPSGKHDRFVYRRSALNAWLAAQGTQRQT